MATNLTVLAPVLGGTALVLGIAYGLTARDHRSAEIEAARSMAAVSERAAEDARARLSDLTVEIAALTARAQAQETELAALQEQLAAMEANAAVATEPLAAAPPTGADASGSPFGDPAHGETVFAQCSFCHQVGQGAANRTGPHLNGIFGRRAGSIEGFRYSKAMERAYGDGLTWTAELLDAYIENPRVLITGTRMSFDGIKDAQDRHDVIAYLRRFSDNPQNIPESAPTATAREVALPPDILAIVGDAEYGEYLASECLTCHKRDGADQGIPSIVYWPEEDFVVAMHAYKQKLRPHPVMQMMAGRLSDEEIAALAAYFAEIE